MKLQGLAAATLLVGVGVAHAADLPYHMEPVVPQPIPLGWTGPYASLMGGVGWLQTGNSTGDKDMFCVDPYCGGFTDADHHSGSGKKSSLSATGGAALGYDVEVQPGIVVGGAVDVSVLDGSASHDDSFTTRLDENQTVTMSHSDSVRTNWLGTARLRAGFVYDRTLFYATGGLAFGDLSAHGSSTTTLNDQGGPHVAFDGSGGSNGMAFGYALGVGAEYRFDDHLSLGLEYLYAHLSRSYDVTVRSTGAMSPVDSTPVTYNTRATLNANLLRAVLSYRF